MTTATRERPLSERQVVIVQPRGLLATFWRRFKKNRLALIAAAYLLAVYLMAIFANVVAPHSPEEIDLLARLTRPSPTHPLGTDETGRDVLSRLIFGARVSLTLGLLAMLVAVTLGTLIGSVAGFAGGAADSILMRFTDGMLVVPTFFLALTVLAAFGPSLVNVVLTIGCTSWMVVARVVRSEVLRTTPLEFVQAARVIGATSPNILIRHVLPQAVPTIIVASTLGVAHAILTESSLSYLGLGVQPPTPTWGVMLSGAQTFLWTRPELAVYPGLMILISVLAFNSLGDALRDALDPRDLPDA